MGNTQQSTAKSTKDSAMVASKTQVIIKSQTWTRDSHGLFDYEGKNLSKKILKVQRSGIITRNGDSINLYNNMSQIENSEEKELVKVVVRDGEYYLAACRDNSAVRQKDLPYAAKDHENLDNGLWVVVKSIKSMNKGYELSEGSVIRLGRIKFRIKEVHINPEGEAAPVRNIITEAGNDHSQDDSMEKPLEVVKAPSNTPQTCRICLSEAPEADNPFFSPCKCSGTMRSIHVKCLQRWLKSKLHVKENGQSLSVYWKVLECELCKAPYPHTFEVNHKRYDIVDIDRPDCPYVMLELLSRDRNMAKAMHIIKLENKTNIRLGRGHDSDIRITDISVSRCHATIKLDLGKLILEDNMSKFGTLVFMKDAIPLRGPFNKFSVQLGRTVINVTTKKNKTLFPLCFNNAGNIASSGEEDNIEDKLESKDSDLGNNHEDGHRRVSVDNEFNEEIDNEVNDIEDHRFEERDHTNLEIGHP